MNNETGIIKGKLDIKLYEVLRVILNKLGMTQQELIETKIKEFVIENIHLVIDSKSDKK